MPNAIFLFIFYLLVWWRIFCNRLPLKNLQWGLLRRGRMKSVEQLN